MKKIIHFVAACAVMLAVSTNAGAAAGGPIQNAGINVHDISAIQSGVKVFVNYCLSCHSASFMRYNRIATDLGLSEAQATENLIFSAAKFGDTMETALRPEQAVAWLGKEPPDLSVIARSRGADWLYTYMKTFYQDDSGGWNNLLLPNASMPHVLWQLQGIQTPVYATDDAQGPGVIERLELTTPGIQSPAEYDKTVRDLVTFLEYLGEPAKLQRRTVGIWVMLFLVVFTLFAYALKVEFWRDVH